MCVLWQVHQQDDGLVEGWEEVIVWRDSYATALFDPCGGDFTWTIGPAFERRATGCIGDNWKSVMLYPENLIPTSGLAVALPPGRRPFRSCLVTRGRPG